MRQFKFRIWHEDVGEYFYLDLMRVTESGFGWTEDFEKVKTKLKISFENQCLVSVPSKTKFDRHGENIVIEQCTGLQDKDGRHIYEGDVLKLETGDVIDVFWNDRFSAFELRATGNRLEWYHGLQEIKIIGNIHENSELLK